MKKIIDRKKENKKKSEKENKRIELISPAGSWESLASALDSGADAVYFGSKLLNMRANAKNFELNELKKIVKRCHETGKKAYLTLNTIVYDDEAETVEKILKSAKNAGIDAIITWDLAIISRAKKLGIPFHISTQASISNYESLEFYHDLGAECIVFARELKLEQIKKITDRCRKNNIDIKVESFCHGAMCVAVSGRCFTSQFLYGRSANRGDCLQPCRRSYKVSDPETGKELALENNYVMSPKDLCTIEIIDKLIESGIDVLKIEGRNRPPEYVKVVTKAYREAIDAYYENKLTKELKEELIERLRQVYNRKFHTGFYNGTPTADDFTDLYGSDSTRQKIFVGAIKKVYLKIDAYELELNSQGLKVSDNILVTGKTTGAVETMVASIHDSRGKEVKSAKKGEHIGIRFETEKKLRVNDKIFLYR